MSTGVNFPSAKYHGLGNDFLCFDGSGEAPRPQWDELARRLCDRHRGVGADGLIVVLSGSGGAQLTMQLHNADGGRAEMSGNGLRCLALFAREAGLVATDDFVVATDAGLLQVRVGERSEAGVGSVSVEMGPVEVDRDDAELPDPLGGVVVWRGRRVDVGNPHLVLVAEDLEGLDLARLGPALEAGRAGGLNVEWVRPRAGVDELDLRVWERGVGVTLACGTGSVAAASAARAMGLVRGPRVAVHNPGGTLDIDLSGQSVWLSGPAQRIAWLDVNPALLVTTPPHDSDWALAAEGEVEWHWDWATGAGWGTRYG